MSRIQPRGQIDIIQREDFRPCVLKATQDAAIDSEEAAEAVEACLRQTDARTRIFWTPTATGAIWTFSDDMTEARSAAAYAALEAAARRLLDG